MNTTVKNMFAFDVLMLYITNERNVVATECTGVVVYMDHSSLWFHYDHAMICNKFDIMKYS